jgi:hypothetical protein
VTNGPRDEDRALIEALAARSPSESLPLLLEVARRQAARRRPADLTAQLTRDAFVTPSALDQRTLHRLDGVALDVAADFEAIALSPLAPLGCCAAVSPTHQDRVVSTIRGTEVVSDPTNVLAIECARRLADAATSHVKLCTVHQVVRAQRFAAKPGFSQHFRLFALAEAGAARPDHGFEVDAIVSQVALYGRLFDAFEAIGYRLPNRKVTLFVAPDAGPIGDRVRARLREAMPALALEERPLESGYYDGFHLFFGAGSVVGAHVPLADVGRFDWVAKLRSNRRQRLVASGLGLQLVPMLFDPHR